jgi:hypothetical protein
MYSTVSLKGKRNADSRRNRYGLELAWNVDRLTAHYPDAADTADGCRTRTGVHAVYMCNKGSLAFVQYR